MKLEDKYTQQDGRVYLTGIQALVRLPIEQMRRDRAAGLRTGAFISGYEGSPLGGYDLALQRAGALLQENNIRFVPGINEDLAVTSVLGSQMLHAFGGATWDGVLGICYGKGPGIDRSGDALRHANLVGTSRHGAALVLAGDDPTAKSSTIPHQSDWSLFNFGIPVLAPGSPAEILSLGLAAISMSRYSGAWVGLKLVTNVCDGGATVDLGVVPRSFVNPEGYEKFSDYRLVAPYTLRLEEEVVVRRRAAVRQFARANNLDRSFGSARAWLGIVTSGKTYYDLMSAFRDCGIGPGALEDLGIRIAKIGVTWPLEPDFLQRFAAGLETLLVIEEKRAFLETQVRELLFNLARRPRILGKQDAAGNPLTPETGELDPERVTRVVATVLLERIHHPGVQRRLDDISAAAARESFTVPARGPAFCSGCPHNRSTLLPEGAIAAGGIGCSGMAIDLAEHGRGIEFLVQMGGEGVPWIGMSPFLERDHLFQSVGDGTFFHSGTLAISAAVAAGVNITYKLLYNGVVAMTGGQAAAGALPLPELTRKLEAEGVKRIVVLSENPDRFGDDARFANNARVEDRSRLREVMEELAAVPGVTALIYDQQCAAEKRRLRSRGKLAEPTRRLVIHERVCEGCGDCVRESNCMSLHPVETEYGQKIRIHQSSCNKDYSCALGDCPSFVTVNLTPGTGLRKRKRAELPQVAVPAPRDPVRAGERYAILSPGIGGTGVVTINALLATAAWIDGIHAVTLDQTGLAQKGGAVLSSVILSEAPLEVAARIPLGGADLILGFDLLGAAAARNLATARPGKTVAVVNSAEIPTADAIRSRLVIAGSERYTDVIDRATSRGRNVFVDATRIAEGLFASHTAVNVFLMGVAFQAGFLPLSQAALEEAILLNGVEAERNLDAFLWGRKYYEDAKFVEGVLAPPQPAPAAADPVERNAAELERYADREYANAYRTFLEEVSHAAPELREAVARGLYKLMAIKDEYEVARLLSEPAFHQGLAAQWESVESVAFELHPPLLRAWGFSRKIRFGPWFLPVLRVLAALKFVRGGFFDVFGRTRHRREERALIGWYTELIGKVLAKRAGGNPIAMEIALLPDQIRGYEGIKEKSIAATRRLAEEKLATLDSELAAATPRR